LACFKAFHDVHHERVLTHSSAEGVRIGFSVNDQLKNIFAKMKILMDNEKKNYYIKYVQRRFESAVSST
jgi:small-conductance mechanosensitive channel